MKKKCEWKRIWVLIMVMIFILAFSSSAFANGNLDSTKLVTGTKQLISDITNILSGLIGAVTIVLALISGITWNSADDSDKPRAKKKFFSVIGIGGILTALPPLINAILSYYQ